MKKYCYHCKKRISIPLQCKCSHHFCSTHFFFKNHECTYDYKKEVDSNVVLLTLTKKIDKI